MQQEFFANTGKNYMSIRSAIQNVDFLSYRQGDRKFTAYCHPIRTIDTK